MLSTFRKTLRLERLVKRSKFLSSVRFSTNSPTDGDNNGNKSTAAKPSAAGDFKNPWYILSEELKNAFVRNEEERVDPIPVPRETDILVIGGGAIGSSVAYWLKQRNPEGFNVTVIERDPSYTRAATVLSVGGVRQQFSLPENIEMSLFSADFIRNIKEHLSIYGVDPPDVQFNPQGYLFLASEKGEETLHANHRIQTELGAKVKLMNAAELRAKFPWMNMEGITCGCYGLENEGWFDPWLLLNAIRSKASSLGAQYVKGEVVSFKTEDMRLRSPSGGTTIRQKLTNAMVKHENGESYPIQFACAVNCGGPWSGEIARMAGIGTHEGALSVPLPVEPRKRYVYVVHCPDGPGLETPMLIDPTGVYVRREGLGGHYVCGASPDPENEPNTDNLDVDYSFFNETIWPVLANRIPAFESLKDSELYQEDGLEDKFFEDIVLPALVHRIPNMRSAQVKSAWAGYYDYNYVDQNLIIGNHPHHRNLMFATGCSGHGIQQSPAIGRAIMEYIIDDEFQTIDLRRFQFDRFLDNEPIYETNIV